MAPNKLRSEHIGQDRLGIVAKPPPYIDRMMPKGQHEQRLVAGMGKPGALA